MELINRYIYAVTRRLPDTKRGDIEKELLSIIDDMLEQNQGPEPREKKIIKVLQELGDPDILADNYREAKRYLIGPQLFNKYLMVLKIVLGAVFIGLSIATLVSSIFQEQNIAQITGTYIGSVFAGLMQAFAWVTLGFAIAEQRGVKLTEADSEGNEWSIADLPQIPVKQAAIPRSESIAAIIFSTLFLILFWSAVHLIGIGSFTEEAGLVIVPIFNLDLIETMRWLVVASFIVGIVKETLKLIIGRWSFRLALMIAGLSLVSLVLSIVFLTNPGIWNPNFIAEFSGHVDINFDVARLWSLVTRNIVFVVILGFLIETATVLYKGLKYSNL